MTSFALIIHELTTNAIKYGALSNDVGTVSLSCRRYKKSISLIWCERGGPTITQDPVHIGFGSTLIRRSVESQFGGRIAYHWKPKGLRVLISVPTDLLFLPEAAFRLMAARLLPPEHRPERWFSALGQDDAAQKHRASVWIRHSGCSSKRRKTQPERAS